MATTLLLFNMLKQRYVYKIYHILFIFFLCFVDRAGSRYIHLKKTQLDVKFIFGVFRQTPLQVSALSIAHYQGAQLFGYNNYLLIVLFR